MIRAREVRLVGEKGEQLGVMVLMKARETARKNSLDLVEVASSVVPPVCRLMDYGKYRYEQTKKEREAKKNQKISALKEIRLRPKIGEHDFNAKAKSAIKQIEAGDKVKVTVMFRGRENTHPEIGLRLLKRMSDTIGDLAVIEGKPSKIGSRLHIILTPAKAKPAQKSEQKEDNK